MCVAVTLVAYHSVVPIGMVLVHFQLWIWLVWSTLVQNKHSLFLESVRCFLFMVGIGVMDLDLVLDYELDLDWMNTILNSWFWFLMRMRVPS